MQLGGVEPQQDANDNDGPSNDEKRPAEGAVAKAQRTTQRIGRYCRIAIAGPHGAILLGSDDGTITSVRIRAAPKPRKPRRRRRARKGKGQGQGQG